MQKTIANDILLAEVGRLLAEGHKVELKTKGNSMLPFIVGDRDSVLLCRHEILAPGDIVLAEIKPGTYVLHRIYDIQGDRVTLMGDGNIRGTEHCMSQHILGTVELILKADGRKIAPGKAFAWKRLLPLRRIILGIYRRIAL